jgi:hypothetical protein
LNQVAWPKPLLLVVLTDQGELAFDFRNLDLQGEVLDMRVKIERLLAGVFSLGGK